MIKNEGCCDRILRVILGTMLLTSFYFMQDTYWLLIGIVPLLTGLFSYCPIYHMFGFSSCPIKK